MENFLETINNRPSIWKLFNTEFRNAQKYINHWNGIAMMFVAANASAKTKKKQVDKMNTGCQTLSVEIWLDLQILIKISLSFVN